VSCSENRFAGTSRQVADNGCFNVKFAFHHNLFSVRYSLQDKGFHLIILEFFDVWVILTSYPAPLDNK
jgi:hypothetical protein